MINRRWMTVAIAGCTMLALQSIAAISRSQVEAQEPPQEPYTLPATVPRPLSNPLAQAGTTQSDLSQPDNTEVGQSAQDAPAEDQSQQNRPPSSLSAALQVLRQQFEREETPLGSRGPQCPYSPGLVGKDDTIYSDLPVFMWRASGQTVSLYDYHSESLLWQRTVEDGTVAVAYDGDPLQPGALYRWELTHPDSSAFMATFAVMEEAERDQLSAELERQQLNWQAAGLSEAELAVERATFFGDRHLWSDALQELYVARDTAEMDAMVKEMSIYLCGALESDLQAASE